MIDLFLADRTGQRAKICGVSRQMTILALKQVLVAGDQPILGPGLEPRHVKLEAGGVDVADALRVGDRLTHGDIVLVTVSRADACASKHSQRWLEDAGVYVVSVPLSLTTVDGKEARVIAAKACEALAHIDLNAQHVDLYARDGGEAAVGNQLRLMADDRLAEEDALAVASARGRQATAAAAAKPKSHKAITDCDCDAHISADGAQAAVNANSVDDPRYNRMSANSTAVHMLEAGTRHLRTDKVSSALGVLGLRMPDPCVQTRFESTTRAAANMKAHHRPFKKALLFSLGVGAGDTAGDIEKTLASLRNADASRCVYAVTKPDYLLTWAVLGALNRAIVHAGLQWGHASRSLRFNELATHVMDFARTFSSVAADPRASGLFGDAYAFADALGFGAEDVDKLAKEYIDALLPGYILDRYDYVQGLPWSHSLFYDEKRRAGYARGLQQFWKGPALPARDKAVVKHVDCLGLLDDKAMQEAVDRVADGEALPYALSTKLAQKFGAYLVNNASSEVLVKVAKSVIKEGYYNGAHADARFRNGACEFDVDGFALAEFPDKSAALTSLRESVREMMAPAKSTQRDSTVSALSDSLDDIDADRLSAASAKGLHTFSASTHTQTKHLRKGVLSEGVRTLVQRLQERAGGAALSDGVCPECGGGVACRPATGLERPHDHQVCYACWRKVHATGSACPVCNETFDGLILASGRYETCPPFTDLSTDAACADSTNAAEPRKRKAPGICSCCQAAEIQTPVGTHDKSTCPLNPDAGAAPKPKGPKRPRSDSLPYHLLGSCSRASNRPETRGPIIRPGTE